MAKWLFLINVYFEPRFEIYTYKMFCTIWYSYPQTSWFECKIYFETNNNYSDVASSECLFMTHRARKQTVFWPVKLGGHHSISVGMGGGVAGVFVVDKIFISTWLSGMLKILNFTTYICLYRAVIEVNYFFLQRLPEIIYFKNTAALPLEIEWWPP